MPIYQTAHYRVKPQAIDKVKQAIQEFVDYVRANERGTRMYMAWQQQDDPTRFVHLFIFEDAAALTAHSESEAVKRFEVCYSPSWSMATSSSPITTWWRQTVGDRTGLSKYS